MLHHDFSFQNFVRTLSMHTKK